MVMGRHSGAPLKPVSSVGRMALLGVSALAVLAVISVAALAAVGAVVRGGSPGADDHHGEVVRVIDGDTLIAEVGGEETTIRLLNIDTPETKHPDQPVQCLGPEATEFLTERLPAGTEIELEYDQERTDRYDRTLAGVFESGSLINAEIAREGLGVPVLFEPNDRFLPEVEEAFEAAQRDGAGLFAEDVDCTLPAQLAAQSAAVDAVPGAVEGDPADALASAIAVEEGVDAFLAGLDADGLPGLGNAVLAAPLVEDYLDGVREDSEQVRERAVSARETLDGLKTDYDAEQQRLEEERLEEERLEQERLEREEQERIEREEREEQERKEREEEEERERQEQKERERTSSAPSKPSPSSGSSSPRSSGTDSPSGGSSGSSGSSSGGDSSGGSSSGSSGGGSSSGSSCVPYGPEIPYSDDGGYTGKRYGTPGGKTFRKCS
jgi:micrococcal nuclease